MLKHIKFPITASEFIVHIWKIILVKQKGVCAFAVNTVKDGVIIKQINNTFKCAFTYLSN